jgi:hypothetical protein
MGRMQTTRRVWWTTNQCSILRSDRFPKKCNRQRRSGNELACLGLFASALTHSSVHCRLQYPEAPPTMAPPVVFQSPTTGAVLVTWTNPFSSKSACNSNSPSSAAAAGLPKLTYILHIRIKTPLRSSTVHDVCCAEAAARSTAEAANCLLCESSEETTSASTSSLQAATQASTAVSGSTATSASVNANTAQCALCDWVLFYEGLPSPRG